MIETSLRENRRLFSFCIGAKIPCSIMKEVRAMEYLLAKSYMGGAKMEGHLCVECRKVILDIEQF